MMGKLVGGMFKWRTFTKSQASNKIDIHLSSIHPPTIHSSNHPIYSSTHQSCNYPSIHLPICLSIQPHLFYLPTHCTAPIHSSLNPPITYPSTYPSCTHPFIHPSTHPSIHTLTYPLIHPFIHSPFTHNTIQSFIHAAIIH